MKDNKGNDPRSIKRNRPLPSDGLHEPTKKSLSLCTFVIHRALQEQRRGEKKGDARLQKILVYPSYACKKLKNPVKKTDRGNRGSRGREQDEVLGHIGKGRLVKETR